MTQETDLPTLGDPVSIQAPDVDLQGLLDGQKTHAPDVAHDFAPLDYILDQTPSSAEPPAPALHSAAVEQDLPDDGGTPPPPGDATSTDFETFAQEHPRTGDSPFWHFPIGLHFSGVDGQNVVRGTSGNDDLHGTDAADILLGRDGNDVLDGGGGADTLKGGKGDDLYHVGAGDVVIELAGGGTDSVTTSLSSYQLGDNVENLTGVVDTGQTLVGNQLANTITGAGGNDALSGGAGGDTLIGGAGDDTLTGDPGGNTSAGQHSVDVPTLPVIFGDDTFVFHSNFGHDTITDFDSGTGSHDTIQFDTDVFANFAAVLAAATLSGADTVITLDADNSIVLKGVSPTDLHQDDFKFIAP